MWLRPLLKLTSKKNIGIEKKDFDIIVELDEGEKLKGMLLKNLKLC